MNYISRIIEKNIEERLFKGKIIIIYGARQVGKTTLSKKILSKYGSEGAYFNCEMLSIIRNLSELEAVKIKAFLGDHKLVVLDEAQNVPNIGKVLKIMVDTYPEMQVIATGSASFDLMQKISEPMTGRNFKFILHPISLQEIKDAQGMISVEANLENILRFGSYPEIFGLNEKSAVERLNEISSNYLFKDILNFDGLKRAEIIRNLLRLLALQIGQEVSYHELATQLGIDRLTVQKYIDILEQCFIVFRLRALSQNKRKEISKSIKVYFYDLGMRNSIIENYNKLEIRNDVGFLWENLCLIERIKMNEARSLFTNSYFWRTYDQKGIDLVEEREGKFFAYEFKWKKDKIKEPKEFLQNYSPSEFQVINKENYWKFLLADE
jgi:predicted AAA+ superfamily ATPase